MLNLIIFGPPGSGKGTQSVKIVQKYDLLHLSTGELLREEMQKDTPLGREVSKYIDQGLLVPDDIVWRELYEYVSQHLDAPGFIFDGFPRTIVQAKSLDCLLQEKGAPISLVISVEVEEGELFSRLLGRSEDSGRSDDSAEIAKRRLQVYKDQTFPLISYYKAQGKIVSIDGMAPVDEVFARICEAVDGFLAKKKG
ncbi:MAG: adenylate kinase [Bacteroidales bacterium]